MMKLGKSMNFEELFEPLLCACRRRWRRRQPLLLLSLQTGEIAYFESEVLSWQEMLDEAYLADMHSLTDALRELLLQHEVEEEAAVLLLPAAEALYSEQLLLPSMQRRDLQAALMWELQQSAPRAETSYSYSFEANAVGEADEQQYQVTYTALPDTYQAELEQLCSSLLLKLQGIWLGKVTLDAAATAWFAGKPLPPVYRQQQKNLQSVAATFGRWLPKVSCICFSTISLWQCLGRLLFGAA